MAGLAEAVYVGQALLMASATGKLHRQLEVQQGPCGCASLRAKGTVDLLGTAVCTAQLLSSKFLTPALFSSGNCDPNLSSLSYAPGSTMGSCEV